MTGRMQTRPRDSRTKVPQILVINVEQLAKRQLRLECPKLDSGVNACACRLPASVYCIGVSTKYFVHLPLHLEIVSFTTAVHGKLSSMKSTIQERLDIDRLLAPAMGALTAHILR